MVFIFSPVEGDQIGAHPRLDKIQAWVDCFLVAMVSLLVKDLINFLIVARLIEGYILTASTDAIVTPLYLYLFI